MSKKKNKVAIALNYDESSSAPRIVAKGKGYVAEKIIDQAIENDIIIHENESLTQDLIKLEIGQEIPEELYVVVAEILTFVYDLDKEESEKRVL